MTDEIKWEDPPEYVRIIGSGKSPGRHAKFAAQLREHPGRWAVLPDAGVSTEASAMAKAQNIRRGKVRGFKAGEFETAVDSTTIYVRFVGKEQPPQTEKPAEEPGGDEGADTGGESAPSPTPLRAGPDAATIRNWAHENGFDVPERGRLPRDLVERYHIAMQRRAQLRAVEQSESDTARGGGAQ